ncbi:lipoyl(octanoyl) transferase LipB [Desulforhopalus sp. IMCC35007]|nr:lipoyl(octanoyl) transferase LipB [Desulforhopalus sp. IMCC35007]
MKPRRPGDPVSVAEKPQKANLLDLGLSDYAGTYRLQQELVARRKSGGLNKDLFLVTEHPATFTLGRRGGRENLMVSETFLQKRQIPLVHIERGGDITFHGQGQLVIYPIFDLRRGGLTVADYVACLEEVMLQLAASQGVVASRDKRNHGVWVGSKKLGSVGIAIRHGISFHGLALNVNISLEPFSWVNPCGLTGVSMTTLSREAGRDIQLAEVKQGVGDIIGAVFGRHISVVSEVPESDTVQ